MSKKPLNNEDGIIDTLANQPFEVMEKVLSNASKQDVAIEVDGVVYHIPKPVSDLIDNLAVQAGLDEPDKTKVKSEA
jgi:hypothetical protein|tara:strand:- start:31720 stop:31950 length:231 start_codon:yes stop_codon:yes gene_type:complete